MNFKELGLRPEILQAIENLGYEKATPIQVKAIPPILEGRDMIGSAQTGTGKNCCFRTAYPPSVKKTWILPCIGIGSPLVN